MTDSTASCAFRVKHTHLPVSDRRRTIDFYERHFGFRAQCDAPQGDGEPATVIRSPDGFQIALENAQGTPDIPHWFHLGLLVASADDCRSAHERLRASGVRIEADLLATDRLVVFTCTDPDGYRLQVYWDAAEAPAPA